MKLNTTALLAFAASASAISEQLVKNYCQDGIYLTLSINATEDQTGPFILPFGEAYISNITGEGNTAIVSRDPHIFSEVAKLVLGTSSASEVLYWAVSNLTGDPLAGKNFNITSGGPSSDVCQNTTGYDGQVHACADQDVVLTLNLCSINP